MSAQLSIAGKVLVVEDEPLVRKLVVATLTSSGYQVVSACGPVQAIELLELDPAVTLLLTDIVMPTGDGCELARQMRARYPRLKVLFMSGYLPRRSSALDGGKLLRKPFRVSELLNSVAQTLG